MRTGEQNQVLSLVQLSTEDDGEPVFGERSISFSRGHLDDLSIFLLPHGIESGWVRIFCINHHVKRELKTGNCGNKNKK